MQDLEAFSALRQVALFPDIRQMNALQMAYIGDTLHDLYVRSHLLSGGYQVGKMHKKAVHMVSAAAQAEMLLDLEPMLTEEEQNIVRMGRNAQAKHQAPKNASPADYSHATALEALWGYLYIKGRIERLLELMNAAINNGEKQWDRQK